MGGSGIKEVLSTIYAEKTVDMIFTGHAYARAVRAHSLLQLALIKLIFKELETTNSEFHYLMNEDLDLPTTLCNLSSEDVDIDNITHSIKIQQLISIVEKKMQEISSCSKTRKLWINYIKMVSIFKDFIAAERMGKWNEHLVCVELLLPYFHAAGHLPYAKSAQLYLQDMRDLEKKMDPTEYQQFTNDGFFTARRSDKFFCGIHTDQTIEQTLMRSMSVEGGPFKRGVTESVVYKWIKGVSSTKNILDGLESFVIYCSIKVNNTMTPAMLE